MEIVLEGLKGQETVAELCRRVGISQSMYYEWKEIFLNHGLEGLKHGSKSAREKALEEELKRAQRTIGRLTLENEIPKKKRGTPTAQEAIRLVEESAGRYPVSVVCEVLGVSRSAYYKAKGKANSAPSKKAEKSDDAELLARIKAILRENPEFGYRRVWARLRFGPDPVIINRKRVQRLMREHNLQAKVKWYEARRRQHKGKVEVNSPDLLWRMDMTKIWCGNDGWVLNSLIPSTVHQTGMPNDS
ncbi:IS3 family transposase [Calderihabitans maritimus]|uniref:Transposase IS3/IS911 family protein n=1 Tax=Calderihabitans maritimus TaxID=1246530 RepID=A0A1Z5HT74_9FIRM|nr:IS3 family transposase [Calderihabitans maritimus]GAW92470.1 transposase IS3/IS911 family protein [Calderihabitans maritimus]